MNRESIFDKVKDAKVFLSLIAELSRNRRANPIEGIAEVTTKSIMRKPFKVW